MGPLQSVVSWLLVRSCTQPLQKMRAEASVAALLLLSLVSVQGSALVRTVGGDPDPDDWLPMPPYRCIQHGGITEDITGATQEKALKNMLLSVLGEQKLKDNPDCGKIDPAWCKEEGKLYPIPCNCHAYFQCVKIEPKRPLLPCPHKCEPYDLVFNPMNGVCNNKDTAPPGTCFDTPTSPMPSPSTPTTKPTTPTTKPTTPTTKPTTKPTTTPNPAKPCTYVGEKLPYPGDCHKYYLCLKDTPSSPFHVQAFTCKQWVYDPNAYSCVASSKATDNLC